MSNVLKFLSSQFDPLQNFLNFVKMVCTMIKACCKKFSSIASAFLKLQYSKVSGRTCKSWLCKNCKIALSFGKILLWVIIYLKDFLTSERIFLYELVQNFSFL